MENKSKNTALVPVSFPNGNSIVGPKVLEYATLSVFKWFGTVLYLSNDCPNTFEDGQ